MSVRRENKHQVVRLVKPTTAKFFKRRFERFINFAQRDYRRKETPKRYSFFEADQKGGINF